MAAKYQVNRNQPTKPTRINPRSTDGIIEATHSILFNGSRIVSTVIICIDIDSECPSGVAGINIVAQNVGFSHTTSIIRGRVSQEDSDLFFGIGYLDCVPSNLKRGIHGTVII
jgi:hypothetical protein